ncbi:MAG: hypothetical protein JXQ75_11990 [Phycisphaerae bacterium]|nr:hypothetical protein [Phycisphaerae bacterium]
MYAKTKTRALLPVLLLLPTLATSGTCDQIKIGSDGQLCSSDPVASVVLAITDAEGETIPAATIVFSIDGGQSYIGGCTGNCDSVVLAFDAVGRFEIAVSALGYVTAEQSVVVEMDDVGCHPVTREVSMVLERDQTVGALSGAWGTSNYYGDSVLRFGDDGEIIGAILYRRTIGGDGNFYIAYNGRLIRGAPGQEMFSDNAPDPTRSGDTFHFRATTLSQPVGFENATISADYNTLTGMLQGVVVTYTRLSEIPEPLLDPE